MSRVYRDADGNEIPDGPPQESAPEIRGGDRPSDYIPGGLPATSVLTGYSAPDGCPGHPDDAEDEPEGQ